MDDEETLSKRSFDMPSVNPFKHKLEMSFLKMLQIILMSVTIAPLRFVIFLASMVLAWMMGFLFTLGLSSEMKVPVGKFRRMLFQLLFWLGRIQFFIFGFMWVSVKGKRAKHEEANLLVAAPHSGFFDALLWFCTCPTTSVLSRKENAEAAVFGTLLKAMQPVLVSRHDPQSRQKTISEIRRRTSSKDDWPQIIIFPEGTCTNRKGLITFKTGAFIPGVPVQPVVLRYPNYFDTYTWTMDGPGVFKLLWFTMCQFYTKFEVEYLPVYHPNEEEISSPKIFSQNVQRVMARALGIPCTDYTYDDCRLMYHARSKNLPMEAGLIEVSKLSEKLGMDINGVRELLDEFATISNSCKDGLMRIEEFSSHLNLPITDELRELFHLYDKKGYGYLDFRQYVIGLSLVSQAAVKEKIVKLAFKVFDRDGDGLISREEMNYTLKAAFGSDSITESIYDKIDKERKGKIDFDQFYSFVKKRPEYARVFLLHAELGHDDDDDIPAEKRCSAILKRMGAEELEISTANFGFDSKDSAVSLRRKTGNKNEIA